MNGEGRRSRALALQHPLQELGGPLERRKLFGVERLQAIGEVRRLAPPNATEERRARRRQAQRVAAAISRHSGALDEPVLLQPGGNPRRGRPPDAFALGELTGRERPVALDRDEGRALRRTEAWSLLAQASGGARDGQAKMCGDVD